MGSTITVESLDSNPVKMGTSTILYRSDLKKYYMNTGTFDTPVFEEIAAGASNNEFTLSETWSPVTGLSGAEIKLVHVDSTGLTNGAIIPIVDGTDQAEISTQVEEYRFYEPATSLEFRSQAEDDSRWFPATATKLGDYTYHAPFYVTVNCFDFSADGTRLYIMEFTEEIYEYSLSTAWDPSSLTYTGRTIDISSSMGDGEDMKISDDGLTLMVMENTSEISEWAFSTAYEIDTITERGTPFNMGETGEQFFSWHPDGDEYWHINDAREVDHFTCTAWDISTSVKSGGSFPLSLSADITVAGAHAWNEDGTRFFVQRSADKLGHYICSTPYDLTTRGSIIGNQTFNSLNDGIKIYGGTKSYIFGLDDDVDALARHDSIFNGPAYVHVL